MDRWRLAQTVTAAVAILLLLPGTVFANAQLTGFTVSSNDPALAQLQSSPTPFYDYIFKNGLETPCSEDADHDGLPDCVETNTGIYVSASNTGTDPHNPDTDGDGLLDGEEVHGTAGLLDLPAMGVSPVHKDILIEYDWFNDTDSYCTIHTHTHRPNAAIVQDVHNVFASAPVLNPDGTTGINAIQDYGQGTPFTGGNLINDPSNPQATLNGLGADYQAYETANFTPNRHGYFHYVLMAHTLSGGASGIATIGGDQVLVTEGCWAADQDDPNSAGHPYIRNTIVHELGHNLGLQHGGDEACNNKPNYSSVMNYRYQHAGIDTSCLGTGQNALPFKCDYSRGDRLLLDENHLNETLGMCTGATVPVDWNHDFNYTTSVAVDTNADDVFCPGKTILHDYNDWAHIKLSGVSPFLQPGNGLVGQLPSCGPAPSYRKKPR